MNELMSAVMAYWRDGGILLLPIGLVSFGIWAYIFRMVRWTRGLMFDARYVERTLDRFLLEGRAFTPWPEPLPSRSAAVTQSVLMAVATEKSGEGLRRHFRAGAHPVWEMGAREMLVLAALTAAAPLLGLLGTVTGMVDTFSAAARLGQENAPRIAGGISSALITTQFGLLAALPGVFALTHLRRARHRLRLMLDSIATLLYVSAPHQTPEARSC